MLGNKTLVLVAAVLAVGLFVMPSALSLFAGQHTFVSGATVDCAKCHGAEASELTAGGPHGGANPMPCENCHQSLAAGYDNQTEHAAISPQCIVCHGAYSANAGGNVTKELLSDAEAHMEFYQGADEAGLEQGANEACIACHTMIGTNITWQRATTLVFTAGHDATGWTVGDFAVGADTNHTTTSGGGYTP